MAKKRYTFVLNFGYVETAGLSYMPWVSKNTYKDAKEALIDLATFLRDQFLKGNEVKPKKCCEATKTKDSQALFCTKCGASLTNDDFDAEEFCEWLRQLETDTDTFNGFIEYDQDARWQAGLLEGSPNQRFVYQAEWTLSAALGHPLHDGVSFETICKQRTKNRSDSFNYY